MKEEHAIKIRDRVMQYLRENEFPVHPIDGKHLKELLLDLECERDR